MLEIPPPPPFPSSPTPPPLLHLSEALFVQKGGGGWRERGAEVGRSCSLAGSAAFIISQKSRFHFHFPSATATPATGEGAESGGGRGGKRSFSSLA